MTDSDTGEASFEERFEYFIGLAKSLPTVPVEDPRIQAILKATTKEERAEAVRPFALYGHNFVELFYGLRAQRLDPNARYGEVGVMISQAAQWGDSWTNFLASNGVLLADIDSVLGEREVLSGLMGFHRDIFYQDQYSRERKKAMSDELLSAPNHPLGVDAIHYYYADMLNPLLRQAWVAMENAGIDQGYIPHE